MAKSKRPFYREPAFLDLRDKWYGILAKEGFPDAEVLDPRTRDVSKNLMRGHGNYSSSADYHRNWSPELQRKYELYRQHSFTMLEEGQPEEEAEIFRLLGNGASKAEVRRILGVSQGFLKTVLAREEPRALASAWTDEES